VRSRPDADLSLFLLTKVGRLGWDSGIEDTVGTAGIEVRGVRMEDSRKWVLLGLKRIASNCSSRDLVACRWGGVGGGGPGSS